MAQLADPRSLDTSHLPEDESHYWRSTSPLWIAYTQGLEDPIPPDASVYDSALGSDPGWTDRNGRAILHLILSGAGGVRSQWCTV
jgi:hypothetical protein